MNERYFDEVNKIRQFISDECKARGIALGEGSLQNINTTLRIEIIDEKRLKNIYSQILKYNLIDSANYAEFRQSLTTITPKKPILWLNTIRSSVLFFQLLLTENIITTYGKSINQILQKNKILKAKPLGKNMRFVTAKDYSEHEGAIYHLKLEKSKTLPIIREIFANHKLD